MELKNIVLHQIIREKNNLPKLNITDKLLNSDSPTVIEFVGKIVKSFGSKSPTQGTFQENATVYPFQSMVREYLVGKSFLSFTKDAMAQLEKDIQVSQAKGGYVVFAHYTQNARDFLITIMLDMSEQFTTDDKKLNITKLKTLDIDKLSRANRINLSRWEENDGLYLSFIKGTKTVSLFFQKFIGNTDLTSALTNTKTLNDAVSKFMRVEEYSDEQKEKANQDINEYLEKQYTNKEDVELVAVSAMLSPQKPTRFTEFVTEDDEIEVSGSYRLNQKSDFNVFHSATIKGNGYKIQFEKELIKQKKVIRDGNDVIFKNLPSEQLDKQFGK